MTQPQQPPGYDQVKAWLEAELRHINALIELQQIVKAMRAWLNGDDEPTDEEGTDDAATND